jgi:hypothetical protein
MSNLRFSGHETFHCRHFWIKKGVDFVSLNKDFKSNESVVELGVGKNMVVSINHWLNAFDLISDSNLTFLADKLFKDGGLDPYLEDSGSLWILHYKLLNNNYSSINKIVFDEFRKNRVSSEFTINQISDFVNRKLIKINQTVSPNTLDNDIKVFLRNYVTSNSKGDKNLEDDFSSIFLSLNLISILPDVHDQGQSIYVIEYDSKINLDPLILLFAIKDTFKNEISISVTDIQLRVSDLFLCNREGTEDKLLKLQELGYLEIGRAHV